MSFFIRNLEIPYAQYKPVLTCDDCGLSFILESVIIGEEIQTMNQINSDFCPYCGKDQRT